MQIFKNLYSYLPQYKNICEDIKQSKLPFSVYGLSAVHKANFILSLCNEENRPVLALCGEEGAGRRLVEDINAMAGDDIAAFYPARDFVFTPLEGVSHEWENERIGVLGRLLNGRLQVVVACGDGALQHTIPKEEYMANTLKIDAGSSITPEQLCQKLEQAGYVKRPQVEGICQYSGRGGIVDFFPPQNTLPVRIEFWGDEIDTISCFDLESQRRIDTIKQIYITPAREVLFTSKKLQTQILELMKQARGKKKDEITANLQKDLDSLQAGLALASVDKYLPVCYPHSATLLDYFEQPLVFAEDYTAVKERVKNYSWQESEDIKSFFESGVLFSRLSSFSETLPYLEEYLQNGRTILIDTFARGFSQFALKQSYTLNASVLSVWGGMLSLLIEDLRYYIEKKYCCLIMVKTEKAAKTLVKDLSNEGIDAQYTNNLSSVTLGKVFVCQGQVSSGFEYPEAKFALISQGQNLNKTAKHKRVKKSEQFGSLDDLTPGDYVVHVSHGIGIFDGIHKMEIQGVTKDYIKIKYQGADVLFVPVTQLDLVSRYIGPREDGKVKLNKLNSSEWHKTKARVKASAKTMAKELIALYAKRMEAKGYAFTPDDDMQADFEERFEFEETEDQLRCISEIKRDMQRPVPMERLLCGDVGFGKTEVAFRAAFKCIADGKQCAILAPTTILAWQHYQTALKRFDGFPINIEILSRFRTPKQQKDILKRLKEKRVDLVIGTHRLVQKDVEFADLGLAIVDEEQRFGVKHKDKFKEFFAGVDMLTLSATPIPRTLNMAMSGIRDMSVIEQAPQDRHPVQTYVLEYNPSIVADAIRKELRRGGQVFYLYNNTETIDLCAAKIKEMVPDAVVDIGHGKMKEEELSKVWERLLNRETDVLVCTTIIETGVDVSNCNTLIIENADRLGLSQLYQIRGRVGRSSRRAFAYLTFTRGKILTEIATKRLEAIKEFTNFGSGFKIAMRDLQIRGAGSILGASQHGHMESVGYDMYIKLLSQAISEEKGEKTTSVDEECLIDIQIGAHIPESYIENLSQRIEIYKKIAAVKNEEDAMDVTDELIDRFGEPGECVKGLIDVSLVRNMASLQGIYEINQRGDKLNLYLHSIDLHSSSALAAQMKGRVMVNASAKPYIVIKLQPKEKPVEVIRQALQIMEQAIPAENKE